MAPYASLLSLIAFLVAIAFAEGHSFLRAGQVSKKVMKEVLSQEVIANETAARKEQWKAALLPVFNLLPKNEYGNVGHQAARYMLHRAFSKRYGWFIRGLEPTNATWQGRPWEGKDQNEWVPSYLQEILEKGKVEKGIDMSTLLAFAATLEDLVDVEAEGRLGMAFRIHGFSRRASLKVGDVKSLTRTYVITYMMGGNLSVANLQELQEFKEDFTATDADWPRVEKWLEEVEIEHYKPDADGRHTFQSLARFITKLGQVHHTIFNQDCKALKSTFQEMELYKPGRVSLSNFYEMGKKSRWDFEEKADFLRALGALDESNPEEIQVISPNYINSRVNCMEPSNLYVVCCRNECEELTSQIETEVGSTWASTEQISKFVASLPSDSVEAPRSLSPALLSRLDQVASINGGKVPIHGRLFAQWMHHAYPRECPYPHPLGAVSPLTPNEWMQETVQNASMLPEGSAESKSKLAGAALGNADLPWTAEEELIVVRGRNHQLPVEGAETPSRITYISPFSSPYLPVFVGLVAVALMLLMAAEYAAEVRKWRAAASNVLLVQEPEQLNRAKSSFLIGAVAWALASAAWWLDVLDTQIFGLTMVSGVGAIVCRHVASRPSS